MQKLVSIVIPFFNRKEFLCVMLDSIIAQTYKNFEVLLIDDDSTDGATDVANNYAIKDSRIKYLNRGEYNKTKGACSSRNVGLDLAKGEYIIFFDSDDWIPDFCIKNRVNFMESHSGIDFAVFPYFKYYDKNLYNGNVISGIETCKNNDLFNLTIRNLPFTIVSNIYRTQSLRDNNIRWDERLLSIQDADFNVSAISAGLKYEYADNSLFDYYVRMHDLGQSVSTSILNPKHLESHLYYLNKRLKSAQYSLSNAESNAVKLLAISFYRLMCTSPVHRTKLLESIKVYSFFHMSMVIRDCICKLFNYSGYIQKILFFRLSHYFRRATFERGIKGKIVYDKSYEIINSIEDLIKS